MVQAQLPLASTSCAKSVLVVKGFLGKGNVTAQTSQQEVHLKKSDKKSDKTKGQARV